MLRPMGHPRSEGIVGWGTPYSDGMPLDLSGRVIFLASPSNLSNERALCRGTIREFNETRAQFECVTFLVRAWELLSGGIGRPQDKINPEIDDCDFMILLLGDRWGSPPALDGPYSSGTEEEFHRCLELLAQPEAAMRDVLILFKIIDASRLQDPGPQLLKVMEFRSALEKSKSLFYGTFDSDESLKNVLVLKLTEWAKPFTVRTPVSINLAPYATSVEPSSSATRAQLLESAKAHAANGLLMQAEAAFAHAIKDGDPEALTEFARFMRRTGRLEQALELNKELLYDPEMLSATDAQSVGYKVNSLASMGVIHRKRSSLTESRDLLREAVQTAKSSELPVNRQLCYALDNYGLTLLRIGESDLAIEQFEEAHALRRDFGSKADLAQSAINIARTALLFERYATAESLFTEALDLQRVDQGEHIFANALCGLSESILRRGSTDGVREMLDKALDINTRTQNFDGVSIAHALLARLLLLEGSADSAAEHALACQLESEKTNNFTGRAMATWLLAEIAIVNGDKAKGRKLAVQAAQYSEKTGSQLLTKDIAETLAKLGPLEG